jgi:hypothetical protein
VAVRLLAVGVALALVAGGCGGGGGPSRRDAVAGYLDQVNRIEARLAQPARTISAATAQLAQPHSNKAAAERKLRAAARRIDTLRVRLRGVPAPVEATKIRTLLLELLGQEAGLAREVAAYVAFVPTFRAALRPLVPAGAQLKHELSTSRSAARDASALDRYA